jgi:hypothetical protein
MIILKKPTIIFETCERCHKIFIICLLYYFPFHAIILPVKQWTLSVREEGDDWLA